MNSPRGTSELPRSGRHAVLSDPKTLFAAAAADDVDALARFLCLLRPPSAAAAAAAEEEAAAAPPTAAAESTAAEDAVKAAASSRPEAGAAEEKNLNDFVDEDGRTVLHVAAAAGRLKAVQLLLRSGASPFQTDEGGWTCLMSAASAGHVAVVAAILQNARMQEEQQQQREKEGDEEEKEEAEEVARRRRRTEDPESCGSATAAASNGSSSSRSAVQQLLDMRNPSGSTALGLAAAKGHVRVIEELLRSGADINAADKYGRTPLLKAVAASREAAVEFLVDRGAELSGREKFTGDNALHLAVNAEHADICLLLMKKKPELKFQKNKEGITPFEGGRTAFLKHLALLYEEEGVGQGSGEEEQVREDNITNS